MKPTVTFTLSDIPEDGLRFFHGLSNWVEQAKILKPHLAHWKQGQKALTKLACIKSKQREPVEAPSQFPCNTLYVPGFSSGIYVIRQLRHAFCHNGLRYDKAVGQYRIELTDDVKITGQFSLEAIEELVKVFM